MSSVVDGSFPVDGPFDLGQSMTLSEMWGACTWMRREGPSTWYCERTADGPATVQMLTEEGQLRARAWGPGRVLLMERVPVLSGLIGKRFVDVHPAHPIVRRLQRRWPGYRVARNDRIFPRLISVALAQKVTGKNSKAALRRMAWTWGEAPPGPRPDLRLLPSPEALVARPYEDFHPLGIERHRADLVRRIASRAANLDGASTLPWDEAQAHLRRVRGIGPWTAGIVLGGPLGNPDAVPVGDYHLPNYIVFNLEGEARGTDARMLEVLTPYAGMRGMVVRATKAGGSPPPRYGPKTRPRDIRGL